VGLVFARSSSTASSRRSRRRGTFWTDADLYGQRSQNETVNSRLKRKYGAFVRSRHWWKQFRELAVVCLTHNIDKSL